MLKIFYYYDKYISLARTAVAYQRLLAPLATLVRTPETANMCILHVNMQYLTPVLHAFPFLRQMYRVAYLVWETDRLPSAWVPALAQLDEIWTASAYCYEIFARYHPRVFYVPHMIDDYATQAPPDMQPLAALIDLDPRYFYYLTISSENTTRKNTAELIKAFAYVARRLPQARLLVKTLRYPIKAGVRVEQQQAVITLEGSMSPEMLHALYLSSKVYACAHHSEGWGLPMADALALGKLVVAPAYSGNLDFLTPYNALLVACQEAPVEAADVGHYFSTAMRWGNPYREMLEQQLMRAYAMTQNGSSAVLLRQAAQDIEAFSAPRISACLAQQLERIAHEIL